MKVIERSTAAGVLQDLTFRPDEETFAELKTAVKSWLATNYPTMTWENFYDRCLVIEADRMVIDMVDWS